MARYLIVSPTAPRAAGGRDVAGLAYGLIAAGHSVMVLAPASTDVIAGIPGLARRLRTLKLSAANVTAGESVELAVYEGRFSAAEPQLLLVETPVAAFSSIAQWLGAIAENLADDPWLPTDTVIGWGEVCAPALPLLQGNVKLLVLSDAEVGDPTLVQAGAHAAQAVLVPHLGQAAALKDHAALATRASDELIAPFRLGSDEPPRDPATDPALPHHYSAAAPEGKQLCRRHVARRLGLMLGPRTTLLAVMELREAYGDKNLIDAIVRAQDADVAVALWADGDRALIEHASLLALEHPTRVALVRPTADTTDGERRALVAAADALWIGAGARGPEAVEADRRAGLAQRYGTLPILPQAVGTSLGLVEVDARSHTGNALFASSLDETALAGMLVRTASLRADDALWADMISILMRTAPTWGAAARVFDVLRTRTEAGVESRLAI